MTTLLSRRRLVRSGIGFTALALGSRALADAAAATPHFFLQILLPGGVDNLYLFDSRSKAFTAAGKVANFAAGDAVPWAGANGGQCLASEAAATAFKPFKSRLAIVNGVHTCAGFEGHDQNANAVISANPFGGRYFAPQLTPASQPLAFVELGSLADAQLTISNRERLLTMRPDLQPTLAMRAQAMTGSDAEPVWRRIVARRAQACGDGPGMLAEGCRAYAGGLGAAHDLAGRLATADVSFGEDDKTLTKAVRVATTYFRRAITSTALVIGETNSFDTHGDAQESPRLFDDLIRELAAVFDLLASTPFDEATGLSMLDVTTVMVSSEFGRTHGQAGKSVDKTGTDHNPQANMVILAGRGIKGDQVIGSTDLDALDADGAFAAVSGAHKRLDGELLKKMGRPFDFDTGRSRNDLPESYDLNDYITSASVINTVLDVFGVDRGAWLKNDTSRQNAATPAARPLKVVRAVS